MGEHIIGHLVQTSKKHQYRPGNCSCFHCSAFSTRIPCHTTYNIMDWQIGSDTCCGGFCKSQPRCVQPDKDECYIGLSSKGQDPLVKYEWNRQAPNLRCVYNLDKIDTKNQIIMYQDKFGDNNDIISKYCTQKVNTCPKGMKECSRLKSIGEGGNECRFWFEKQPDYIQDAAMQNYCLRHNTKDCKCVNRANSHIYQALKGSHSINDGCWYSACANEGQYLVPTHLINPTCPDKMCQVIFDIIKDRDVSIDNVQNDIVCNFKHQEPSQPIQPIKPEHPNERPDHPSIPKDRNFLEYIYRRNKYELIAIVILIVILLIILMI